MKYIDSIVNALMEVHIFEMAHQRKTVIDKTRNLATHLASHISKVALWPDHPARKHWEKEIHAACSNINRNKYDGKKKLKEHEYFKYLHNEPIEDTDFIQDVAKSEVRNDGMPDHKWTPQHYEELNQKVRNVYKTLSKQLADNDYEHIEHTLKNNGI